MGRWEPDAAGRLRAAATDLYLERGFDHTTVAEIAERAGLTARTFFRYFADKREVLFGGSERLQQLMLAALEAVPPSAPTLDAVAAALDAAGEMLTDREFSGRRQQIINSHAELQERELIKMSNLAAALADGLRKRGVPDTEASLAAETAVAVFRVAFAEWIKSADDISLGQLMTENLAALKALAG